MRITAGYGKNFILLIQHVLPIKGQMQAIEEGDLTPERHGLAAPERDRGEIARLRLDWFQALRRLHGVRQ